MITNIKIIGFPGVTINRLKHRTVSYVNYVCNLFVVLSIYRDNVIVLVLFL